MAAGKKLQGSCGCVGQQLGLAVLMFLAPPQGSGRLFPLQCSLFGWLQLRDLDNAACGRRGLTHVWVALDALQLPLTAAVPMAGEGCGYLYSH